LGVEFSKWIILRQNSLRKANGEVERIFSHAGKCFVQSNDTTMKVCSWWQISRLAFVKILLEGEHFILSLINIETVKKLAEK
jgi:hypothetical protein